MLQSSSLLLFARKYSDHGLWMDWAKKADIISLWFCLQNQKVDNLRVYIVPVLSSNLWLNLYAALLHASVHWAKGWGYQREMTVNLQLKTQTSIKVAIKVCQTPQKRVQEHIKSSPTLVSGVKFLEEKIPNSRPERWIWFSQAKSRSWGR